MLTCVGITSKRAWELRSPGRLVIQGWSDPGTSDLLQQRFLNVDAHWKSHLFTMRTLFPRRQVFPTVVRESSSQLAHYQGGIGFFCSGQAGFTPLYFTKTPVLIPVFAIWKKSKGDFCFREMEIPFLLYAISAYERFHRNALLLGSGGSLHSLQKASRSVCGIRAGKGGWRRRCSSGWSVGLAAQAVFFVPCQHTVLDFFKLSYWARILFLIASGWFQSK